MKAVEQGASASALRPRWVTTEDEFRRLRGSWNRLAERSVRDSLFLRHEWFDAAWQWLKTDGAQLRLLCAWRDDQLAAVCPLALVAEGRGVRRLRHLAVPDTQRFDLVTAAEDHAGAAHCLAHALAFARRDWDVFELAHIPRGSPTLQHLPRALGRLHLPVAAGGAGTNWAIPLTGTWDDFYAGRSRRLKKGNNLAANRVRSAGDVELLHLDSADPALAREALADAVRISARSWKQATGLSLDRPGPSAFIQAMTGHALERGWLSLWLLRVGGRPVAMEYQLRFGTELHALRADFDEAEAERSPGAYLNREMIERLFGQGLSTYYLGPGSNAYKLRWTDDGESLWRIVAYGSTWRGRCCGLRDLRLRPLLEKLRSAPLPPKGKE